MLLNEAPGECQNVCDDNMAGICGIGAKLGVNERGGQGLSFGVKLGVIGGKESGIRVLLLQLWNVGLIDAVPGLSVCSGWGI